MLSGLAQRVGSPKAVIGLGLATPLLAIGAFALASGGGDDHEVVTASAGRAPTPMPAGPTTTTMYVLTPGASPSPAAEGAKPSGDDAKKSSKSGTSKYSTSSGSSKRSGSTSTKRSTSTKSGSSRSKTTTSKSSKSSGSSTASGSGGSTGGVTTTTRRSSPTTGGGSGGGGGGGGGGATTTTQPPATTTTAPSGPVVLLADFMGYSGDLTSAPFGSWSVVSTGGGSITGTGDAVDLSATPGGRSMAVVGGPYDDVDLSVDVTSLGQGGGQDTAWVVWHYSGPDSFMALYLGADGWGIVSVTSGGVEVLNSGASPSLGLLGTATVRVVQVGDLILATADGVSLGTADAGAAYAPSTSGAVGIAVSGAAARFDNVVVRST